MAALSLILNSHSVENVPVVVWYQPLLALFQKAGVVQPAFKKVSVSHEFRTLIESDETMQLVPKQFQSLLRSKFASPYLNLEDEDQFADKYIENEVFIEHLKEPSEPAKISWLYDFPLLSYAIEPWDKANLEIVVRQRSLTGSKDTLRNIAIEGHIKQDHQDWLLSVEPAPLPVSSILPENKKVHIQKHHGEDLLKKKAKQFKMCPWIEEIESNEWNSDLNRFVWKTYLHQNHWYAAVVLHQTKEGFGMLFRLTARNKFEADRIALELEKLYP